MSSVLDLGKVLVDMHGNGLGSESGRYGVRRDLSHFCGLFYF